MIQFTCIYCGQSISAQENERGQKGDCPNCNHLVVVPSITKDIPAISTDIPEHLQQARPEQLQQEREAIATFRTAQDAEIYKEKTGWLIPTYDELSLFLMAFTLIMLLISNPTMREQIYKLMTGFYKYFVNKSYQNDGRSLGVVVIGIGSFLIAIMVLLYGFGLSIYHLYTAKQKTTFEKEAMLIFAVVTNICTALLAGIHTLRESTGWTIIFPIWNLINAGLLLEIAIRRMIDERCITDREATYPQIILGMTAIFIIFVFCNFVFNLYWAITFSICIVYTTSFDRALQNVFPGLINKGIEEYSNDE